MYLLCLFLPLLSFISIIVFSRFVTKDFIIKLNIFGLLSAIFLTFNLIYEIVFIGSNSVIVDLGTWFSIGVFSVKWQFMFDSLSVSMMFLVLIISTLVHFYSWEYMGSDPHFLRFISFLSIFTFFMLLFVTAGNFLQMFFGWEGVGLSSYLLINFWYTRLQANKSAMKAIIVNRISDLTLYFSLFTLFFIFGTLDYLSVFSIVSDISVNSGWLTFITFLIFVGAVGKSAQLGLHTWLPDAMEGPTPVSALLHAATMVTAGVYLLVRCSHLLVYTPTTLLFVLFIGGLTTFFAGSIGCFQNDIKKIIAYSTCSQLGYMFLVTGLSQFNVSFFHLFNHAFFKALLFLGAGSVIHALVDEQDIRKMGSLFSVIPVTYVSFFIASLALAGIPYLTGFYSKDLLIELTFFKFTVSGLFVYWLALLSAFFTAFYSTRLAYYTFFGWPNGNIVKAVESGNIIVFVLTVLTILSIFTGFTMKELFVGPAVTTWASSLNFVYSTIFFDTELGFIFSGNYSLNKVFPLIITFLSVAVAVTVLLFWSQLVEKYLFRKFYEFINQKWYFDVLYLVLINNVMKFSYYTTFKLVDRGALEFFGSLSINDNLYKTTNSLRFYELGFVYNYIYLGISISLVTLLLFFF